VQRRIPHTTPRATRLLESEERYASLLPPFVKNLTVSEWQSLKTGTGD
jgi:hypothetical protein